MNDPNGRACISLGALDPGQQGRLCRHATRTPVPPRLRELGFVGGSQVAVIRRAPLGDPVEVAIRGARICVRQRDLDALCVEPLPAGS